MPKSEGRFPFLNTGNGRPFVYVNSSLGVTLCGPCAEASHAGGSVIERQFTLPYSEPREQDDYCHVCDECLVGARDSLL